MNNEPIFRLPTTSRLKRRVANFRAKGNTVRPLCHFAGAVAIECHFAGAVAIECHFAGAPAIAVISRERQRPRNLGRFLAALEMTMLRST